LRTHLLVVPTRLLIGTASDAQRPGNSPLMDSSLSPERRAADLVSA